MKPLSFLAASLVAFTLTLAAATGAKADATAVLDRLAEMERRIQHLEQRLDVKDQEIAKRDRMIQSLRGDVSETQAMLERRANMAPGAAAGWTENVELYGLVEAEVGYTDPYDTPGEPASDSETDAVVATVELGAAVTFNDWIEGDILLLFEEDENEDNIAVDNATVTLAPPDSPMALTVGRMYVPFGTYESNMISDSMTLELGETQETALLLSAEGDGVHGGVFLSNGALSEDGDNRLEDFGATLGFAGEGMDSEYGVDLFWMGDIGETDALGEKISENLADVVIGPGEDEMLNTEDDEKGEIYTDGASGFAISGYYRHGNFVLLGEYMAATERFQKEALGWQAQGAEPSAWLLEAGFDYMMGTHPATFAIGMQGTDEALGLELPETRWMVSTSVELGENVGLAIEWAHDEDYDVDDAFGCTVTSMMLDCADATKGTGDSADTLTVQLAAEF